MKVWNGVEWVEPTTCLSHGDGVNEYGTCTKPIDHEDEHEDQEGYVW